MKIAFEASFARDLKRVRDKQLLQGVQQVIEGVKEAAMIDTVAGVKKMQGYDTFYRLRLGDYRIGIEVVRRPCDLCADLASQGHLSIFPVNSPSSPSQQAFYEHVWSLVRQARAAEWLQLPSNDRSDRCLPQP